MKAKVHPADLADREGARVVLDRIGESFPALRHLWADAGYQGSDLREWITEGLGLTLEIVQRRPRWVWVRNDVEPEPIPEGFEVIRRRWVVETHLRLDISQPKDEPRLRVLGADDGGVDLRDDDPANAQKAGARSRMRASQTPSRAAVMAVGPRSGSSNARRSLRRPGC
jgi:transposase